MVTVGSLRNRQRAPRQRLRVGGQTQTAKRLLAAFVPVRERLRWSQAVTACTLGLWPPERSRVLLP